MTAINQNIVAHLWYDKEVNEAVAFYTNIFPESKIITQTTIYDTPSGDAEVVSFELMKQKFMAINGGPHFKFNPSISFFVYFDVSRDQNAIEKMTELWHELSEDGFVLMPFDTYPFSGKYGWIQDKFGVSWQIMLTNLEKERPRIVPSFLFVGDQCGKAEEAINFYTKVFGQSKLGEIARYPHGMEPNKNGTVMFADFMLEKQRFAAMDSALTHPFTFNEAISFLVYCDTQEEIDHYWEKLSAVPEAEQCGWLKDKYGVSWQIVSRRMDEMMLNGSLKQNMRVNQAFQKMKKIDIAKLDRVYKGEYT